MAVVYLAEDLKHHRQVAVKVLRPAVSRALGPERFLREIGSSPPSPTHTFFRSMIPVKHPDCSTT